MPTPLYLAFAASAIASIILGFVAFDPAKSGDLFRTFGYWNIMLCLLVFCLSTLKAYRQTLLDWLSNRNNWLIIALAIVAATFLYTREGGGFKITFDEQTISNVAKSLHHDRLAEYRESSYSGVEATGSVDKRPILFHFLLATTHDIFGYRIENAFYLNAVLTAVLLLLLHVVASRIYNAQAGWIAMLLACCNPIIEQNSSGGGLEILNAIGILSCFLFALLYGENPQCRKRFSCLIIAVALFSHVRYESPFLILPVVATILYYWIQERKIQITWAAVVAPLFFIPIAWQHAFSASSESLKQYKYDSDGFFSFDYIHSNLGHATNFIVSSDKFTANSPILSVLGIISLIAIITLSITRGKSWMQKNTQLRVSQFFGAAIILEFLLILGFTFGQLDDPIVTRLGIPLFILNLICTAVLMSILATSKPKSRPCIYIVISACFLYAIPMYSNHLYTSNNSILKRIDWVIQHSQTLPPGNHLYISYLSQEMELRNIHNISYARAIAKPGFLKMHQDINTYDEIFVVQSGGVIFSNDNTFEKTVLPNQEIGPWYELETIAEVSFVPFNFTRISRVKSIVPNLSDPEFESQLKEELINREFQIYYDPDKETYETWLQTLP